MTYQEILEKICINRFNLVTGNKWITAQETCRKFNEIEWALEALATKLRDEEQTRGEK